MYRMQGSPLCRHLRGVFRFKPADHTKDILLMTELWASIIRHTFAGPWDYEVWSNWCNIWRTTIRDDVMLKAIFRMVLPGMACFLWMLAGYQILIGWSDDNICNVSTVDTACVCDLGQKLGNRAWNGGYSSQTTRITSSQTSSLYGFLFLFGVVGSVMFFRFYMILDFGRSMDRLLRPYQSWK